MRNIYLDHAATTPIHAAVLEEMVAVWQAGLAGNPSSIHSFGRRARQRMNAARDSIAAALGCNAGELVLLSGGTESDNAALSGAAHAMKKRGKNQIITTAIEHHAVLHRCQQLMKDGFEVVFIQPDRSGAVSPGQVAEAMTEQTALVSVMYVNNETGAIQPIEQIGALVKERGALFHVDAVQALGNLPINLAALPIDLMSFSAHKINGPQGVGALYIARDIPFQAQMLGGVQERKRRAGTENIAGIAGFAKAVQLAVASLEEKNRHMRLLRGRLLDMLADHLGHDRFTVNGGDAGTGAPHILNVSFPEVDAETMLMNLDVEGIAAASGSACTSGSLEPSHVLQAMGLAESSLRSAVRFSFGLGNTLEEIEFTAEKIATIISRIRNKR
ncbi:cysteine desulfurase [Paenibacillaceae bacterium]|nr:cysteine desulfurase [Paenibacillaceae bacterium]